MGIFFTPIFFGGQNFFYTKFLNFQNNFLEKKISVKNIGVKNKTLV